MLKSRFKRVTDCNVVEYGSSDTGSGVTEEMLDKQRCGLLATSFEIKVYWTNKKSLTGENPTLKRRLRCP